MTKHISNNATFSMLTGSECLINYLNGNLSNKEQHLLEKEMARDPFLMDAMEGLANLSDEQKIRDSVLLLQKNLQTKIKSRHKQRLANLNSKLLIWLTALILLLLVFVVWLYIAFSLS